MSDLIISGVIDGPLSGGTPKAIELTVINDIDDLSLYGFSSANNGLGSTEFPEFTFPQQSARAGERLYISSESTGFNTFFGFEPNPELRTFSARINGNDAIELFQRETVDSNEFTIVDVFGEVDGIASDQGWSYEDGWAYRIAGTGPDGATFNASNWIFSGENALDLATSNAAANTPFPIPAIYIRESESSTEISDSGITDTYDVVLNTRPSGTVIVTITPGDPGNPDSQTDLGSGAGEPILLTFTPDNYNQPQTVTVSAIDDGNPDNNTARFITHTATSDDPDYDSNSNSRLIFNLDNLDNPTQVVPFPAAGVNIVESGDSTFVSESGSLVDTYDIVLETVPTDIVTVTVSSPSSQIVLESNGVENVAGTDLVLVFDPSDENFSLSQTVTVIATDDGVAEGAHTSMISHVFSSNDVGYDTLSGLVVPDVTATILETGISISALTSDSILEGGVTTYNVVLNSSPTEDVTVTVNPDVDTDLGGGAGTPIDLTFLAGVTGDDLTQSVMVTVVNDADVEGDHTSTITHSAASDDPNYSSAGSDGILIADAIVNIADAGISITEVTTDLIPEGGTTTYHVVLSTPPTSDVTVTITANEEVTTDPVTLTFLANATGDDLTQMVVVTAISDVDNLEGTHAGIITHTSSSADPAYNDLTIEGVTLNITDPGVSIIETNGNTTVSEEGITDTYSIVLNSVPTGAVTITVDPDEQTSVNGAGPGEPVDLLFDASTLSQSVTVTANPDGIVEDGLHSSAISHAITTSAAAEYPIEQLIDGLTVTVIDCFLTGTRLLTDQGECRVEDLKIGDRLQTVDGTLEPIKWVGIQTCHANGCYHPLRTFPIRVTAGSLGNNLPIRDLYVSPDHALLVDGILVNAGALENGTSIVRVTPTTDVFAYYHIELERHHLIIAEGTPVESYLPQQRDRSTFDNGDEYAVLYPQSNMQALIPMRYPRVSSKRQLPRFIDKSLRSIAKAIAIATP